MSRFMSKRFAELAPYVPGEQPQGRDYIKLNTNESPFPVSDEAKAAAAKELRSARLYPDPTYAKLRGALAETYGVEPGQVIVGNGSDEILNFCFMAFCDADHPAVFPDITYGFYPVFSQVNCLPFATIPLADDFTVNVGDYLQLGDGYATGGKVPGLIVIANPNAPTGIALQLDDIARIANANPNTIIVVDEAYVDFGALSCIPLTAQLPNVVVTQTFSKSRSMAGARLGYAIGNADVIRDLETIRNSTNPYNVNSATVALALGVLSNPEATITNCRTIAETRELTTDGLRELGFDVLPSCTNFVFASAPGMGGRDFYEACKARGILVRYLDGPRTKDYVRITIGLEGDMRTLLQVAADILGRE